MRRKDKKKIIFYLWEQFSSAVSLNQFVGATFIYQQYFNWNRYKIFDLVLNDSKSIPVSIVKIKL